MSNLIQTMFDNGVFEIKHKGIVEIYPRKAMKTDTFIYNALNALPIGFNALTELIEKRNTKILEKDAAEERIRAIEKQMEDLQKQLDEAKTILAK